MTSPSSDDLPTFDVAVITITHDRTEGTVVLHTGDLDPWSAWAMLLACADALADDLPTIKIRDDDNEHEPDEDDEDDD